MTKITEFGGDVRSETATVSSFSLDDLEILSLAARETLRKANAEALRIPGRRWLMTQFEVG